MYKILKYNYLYDFNFWEGELFNDQLEYYNLSLVYVRTWFRSKVYLIRRCDVEWLTAKSVVDGREKLQTVMLTCGSIEHIKHWLYDKIAHNYELFCSNMGADNWIPVSERLPAFPDICEVTVKTSNGHLYTDSGYFDECKKEWWKHDDSGLLDVIAWRMPLSKPYQPKICTDKD